MSQLKSPLTLQSSTMSLLQSLVQNPLSFLNSTRSPFFYPTLSQEPALTHKASQETADVSLLALAIWVCLGDAHLWLSPQGNFGGDHTHTAEVAVPVLSSLVSATKASQTSFCSLLLFCGQDDSC